MKIYNNPSIFAWKKLIERPVFEQISLDETVSNILQTVKNQGDSALFDFAKKFDNIQLSNLEVSAEEINEAVENVAAELKNAINIAKTNIAKFHQSQLVTEAKIETMQGVTCWRKNVGIERVGIYIPGGSAPLFSTVLMLAIPAKIAGCKEIILCTPTEKNGKINPIVAYTAQLLGVHRIFKIGGAQAIAAMAYGTGTIPKVNKIFGPGNQYVTKAKALVQSEGVAIDMPAGPSEVLIIADKNAIPSFVAADLLAQAEHGADSQVVLVADNQWIVEKVNIELEKQLAVLPRQSVTTKALENSFAIVFDDLQTCMEFSNLYAPEHLILATANALELSEKVVNAGSVFIGNYSCESAGDYASGTNHTLPTNGYAKSYSGVSVDSFLKKITFQQLDKQGIRSLGNTIELMAAAEGLEAHKNAVTLRLDFLKQENLTNGTI